MDQESLIGGFGILPKELKQIIFSLVNLDTATVLKLQAVSSEFKKLLWSLTRECNTRVLSANKSQRTITEDHFIFKRVNPDIIQTINLSGFANPLNAALSIMKDFPILERIDLGDELEDLPIYLVSEQMTEFDHHPTLREITYGRGYWYRSRYSKRSIPMDNGYVVPAFRAHRNRNDIRSQQFVQKSIAFHRAYHRGGTIGDSMVVIGATDGTLTFLTLDAETNDLKIQSTDYHTHRECINSIWTGANLTKNAAVQFNDITYIAARDGIVSSWSCVNGQPVLNKTFVFPEPILFVCDNADTHLVAAGTRKLYVAEIKTEKIIQEIAVDDDITGLCAFSYRITLATKSGLYALNGSFELEQLSTRPYPNMWASPDGSMVASVKKAVVNLIQRDTDQDLAPDRLTAEIIQDFDLSSPDKTEFDARPHLLRFSPTEYWITMSIGPALVTFNLDFFSPIAFLDADINPLELNPEDPPVCNAFWYAPSGRHLFSLYSDRTLYWWHIRE